MGGGERGEGCHPSGLLCWLTVIWSGTPTDFLGGAPTVLTTANRSFKIYLAKHHRIYEQRNLFSIFVYIFCRASVCWPLFAYVAHFVFLRDVWIRTQRAADLLSQDQTLGLTEKRLVYCKTIIYCSYSCPFRSG
jgi:hypothetical protein